MEELEKRCRLYLRLTNDSRVDETCIEVKGKQKYLYRAVDSAGQTLGFRLAVKRDTCCKTLSTKPSKLSHSIATGDVDKNTAYPKAIDELKAKKICLLM